jgi:drug/metabolite transporter (DMT)-like permease
VRVAGERIALIAFLTESILAGGNAVGVRFSNRELDPLWGAALRFTLAALLLAAIMAVLRLEIPRRRALTGALVYGVVLGGAFALAYYSLVEIRAGLAQTLLALVPLATLLLAVAQRQERLRAAAVAGTLLALGGVAVISGGFTRESVPLLSLLAVLGAMLCFAQATVVPRQFPPVHPVTMNAVGMTTGAVLLVVLSVLFGETIALPERAETWLAIAYMVVFGSVLVFVLYIVVIRLWSASRASYGFVLTPIVTVLASAWLDDEPITAGLLLGGVLVLAGVYVGALRPALVAERFEEALVEVGSEESQALSERAT